MEINRVCVSMLAEAGTSEIRRGSHGLGSLKRQHFEFEAVFCGTEKTQWQKKSEQCLLGKSLSNEKSCFPDVRPPTVWM